MPFEENLDPVTIRMFPSVLKRIDEVLREDLDEVFENRSHFIRCATNNFMRSAKVKRILKEDGK